MNKREKALVVVGSYRLKWSDYSDLGVGSGRFRYLLILVTPESPPLETTPVPHEVAELDEVDARTREARSGDSARGSCRPEVLSAMTSLERRHAREEFALAEIVAEVLANSMGYTEATIRTHVTSVLCANASAHHATRYPDLERVDRGMYRMVRR